ncbi:hypothetical protein ACLB2K_073037 [Fragaria x ananassa]
MYAVRIENPQGYDELMEMVIRHAQADHDTYGETSVRKRKIEMSEGSLVQVVQFGHGRESKSRVPTREKHTRKRAVGRQGGKMIRQQRRRAPTRTRGA